MFLGTRQAAALSPLLLAAILPACGRIGSDASLSRRGPWPAVEPHETVSPDRLDDPALRPTLRELRQARADAWLENEIAAAGGLIRYTSSGSSSWPDQVKFVAAPNALTLGVRADSCLNFTNGEPRPLVLTVYHLAQPINANRLIRLEDERLTRPENGGTDALKGSGNSFGAEKADFGADMATIPALIHPEAPVLGTDRFTIQPGQNGMLSLSRPEGGRYLIITAGYRQRDESAMNYTHMAEYPIGRYEQKEKGWAFLPRHVTMFRPLPLNLEIELGPAAMRVYDAGKLLHPLRDVRVASAYRIR